MTLSAPALLLCIGVYLLLINTVSAVMTAADKYRARRGSWRIPERRLLLFGLLGGAFCEWVTMLLIRHKTKHLKFMLCLPLFITLHTLILGWLLITLFS